MPDSIIEPQEELKRQAEDQEVLDTQSSERTKEQFEKLTTSNKTLKEEKDAALDEARSARIEAEKYKALYETPTNQAPNAEQFANLNQAQVNNAFQGMVDENGYLDGNKLMNVLQTMDKKAQDADSRAKQVEKKAMAVEMEARAKEQQAHQSQVYTKYPWLDPDNVDGVEVDGQQVAFNPDLWELVYNKLAVKAKKGEQPTNKDYMEAADDVYTKFYPKGAMNKQQTKIENQKRQINAARPRSPMSEGYYSSDEDDALVDAMRKGKKGSVAEALRRLENPK